MFARIRSKATYANVVASLALFLALGGVSYAVTALPENSVGAKQLKANAVTGVKVKDGSLERTDFAPGALPVAGTNGVDGAKGEPGATGSTGATGQTGQTGAAGPQGEPGTDGDGAAFSLLDPVNYLAENGSAQIFIDAISIATVRAYRIDCADEVCTLSVGQPMNANLTLDQWYQTAIAGSPSATRDFSIVEFDGGGQPLRRYWVTGGRPISKRTLNDRLEMTFSAEMIERTTV